MKFYHNRSKEIYRLLTVSLFSFLLTGCGGYIELTAGGSRDIASGSTYSAYSNCIWVIKVPDKYVVNLDFTFKGEKSSGGACEDYLEIGVTVEPSLSVEHKFPEFRCEVNLQNLVH